MIFNIPSFIFLLTTLITAVFLSHISIILPILFFFFLQGLLLSRILLKMELPLEERIIVSSGLGMASIPFFSYAFKLLSIPLRIETVGVLFLILAFWSFKASPFVMPSLQNLRVSWRPNVFQLLFIAILLLSLASRLYPIKSLDVPPFADPALEGMVTQLIVQHESIPSTWEPFLPLEFRHQSGFASIAAWFSFSSSLPIPKIILLLTNIFHAFFPFSLYILGYALFKNRWQSLAVAALGLIAAFPTLTFVAGMNSAVAMYTLLPIAAATIIIIIQHHLEERPGFARWGTGVFFFILFAGATLIHPTFVFFLLLLLGPYVGLLLITQWDLLKRTVRTLIPILAACALTALILLPLFQSSPNKELLEEQWHIQASYLNPQEKLSPFFLIEPLFFLFDNPQGVWYFYLENVPWGQLITIYGVGILMIVFFFYALSLAWRSKNKMLLYPIILYLLFLVFSTLQSFFQFEFPGWNLIYTTRIKFLMIIPLALLLSFPFIQHGVKLLGFKFPLLLFILLIIPHNLFSISGELQHLSAFSAFSDADKKAIQWVKENVPKDSVILNPIKDVEAGVFIGGPAQWIPSLTGNTIVFPALSLTENLQDQGIANRLAIMNSLEAGLVSERNFLEILQLYNVRYVFLTPRHMYSRRELFADIQPEQFAASPYYVLEYSNEDVSIFSIAYPETSIVE